MLVYTLIYQEMEYDERSGRGTLGSTVYEFERSRWVTVRSAETAARRVGPVGLVESGGTVDIGDTRIRAVDSRALPVKFPDSARARIMLTDEWTMPPESLYVLLLPQDFVPTKLDVRSDLGDATIRANHDEEGRLFYFSLFRKPGELYINGVFDLDEQKARVVAREVEEDPQRTDADRAMLTATSKLEHLKNFGIKMAQLGGWAVKNFDKLQKLFGWLEQHHPKF